MKLFEKVLSDLENAKSKGFNVTKSFGTFKNFCQLKKVDESLPFSEKLSRLNDYLHTHGLHAYVGKKGLLFCRLENFKPAKVIKKEELTL